MDIDQLLNKRASLPPLPPLTGDLADLDRPHSGRPPIPKPPPGDPLPPEASDEESSRSNPYTLMDDLSIFRVVAVYYGSGFCGKIPWSFWQTYKKATGSTRSNSSLYHHWNGAMKKKYEAYISTGRLAECILWLETAVMTEQPPPHMHPIHIAHAGMPLHHSMSGPSIPLSLGRGHRPEAPRALTRTASCFHDGDFPFSRQIHQ